VQKLGGCIKKSWEPFNLAQKEQDLKPFFSKRGNFIFINARALDINIVVFLKK